MSSDVFSGAMFRVEVGFSWHFSPEPQVLGKYLQ
jgi:hypothetical protein